MRPHATALGLVLLAAVAGTVLATLIPLVAKSVIDGPLAQGDGGGLLPLAGLALALGLAEALLAAVRRYRLAEVSTAVEARLRDDLYAHLQRLPVAFHDRVQSGQLLSRAFADVSAVRRFVGFASVFLIANVLTVAVVLGLMVRLHALLALLTAAVMVPVGAITRRFALAYRVASRRVQDRQGDLTTTIEESAAGIRVIKAFGRGPAVTERFVGEAVELRAQALEAVRLRGRFESLLGLVPRLALAAVLLGGAVAVGRGALSLGGLAAFIALLLMLVWPVESLGWILAVAEEAVTATERIGEVLDTEPAIADIPGAVELATAVGRVRFEGVQFSHPGSDRPVLAGVDLELEPGEVVAVAGVTGSGKTTLLSLVPRLADVSAGRVTLDGHDVRDLTLDSLRRQVGVAFEDPVLFSASVRENLLLGHPHATDDEIAEAIGTAQASFVHDLPWGLDTRIGEQGLSLSGGQRQRLALARAILGRPPVLVLDDPLSALDVHTEGLVESALATVLAGSTALVVVHRPSTVALADRVVLLDEGRVAATGTHAELLATEERYAAVLSQRAEAPEPRVA